MFCGWNSDRYHETLLNGRISHLHKTCLFLWASLRKCPCFHFISAGWNLANKEFFYFRISMSRLPFIGTSVVSHTVIGSLDLFALDRCQSHMRFEDLCFLPIFVGPFLGYIMNTITVSIIPRWCLPIGGGAGPTGATSNRGVSFWHYEHHYVVNYVHLEYSIYVWAKSLQYPSRDFFVNQMSRLSCILVVYISHVVDLPNNVWGLVSSVTLGLTRLVFWLIHKLLFGTEDGFLGQFYKVWQTPASIELSFEPG